MKYIFFLLVMFFGACGESSHSRGRSLYIKSLDHLYKYYATNDTIELLLAKEYIENADNIDPQGRGSRFVNRMGILYALKDYKSGIDLVTPIDSSKFAMPYHKNLFLKTYKALQAKVEHDTLAEKKYLEELITEIEDYIINHGKSMEAYGDLYYTKLRLLGKRNVILELKNKRAECGVNIDDFDALIATIASVDTLDF